MAQALAKQKSALLLIFGLAMAVVLGFYSSAPQMSTVALGFVVVAIILLAFFSVPISLQLLIASMLLSPEIAVGHTIKRDITIRLDDIILTAMIFSWLLRMAVLKDVGFVHVNPLNKPIIAYSTVAALATTLGVWRGNVHPMTGFFFCLKILEYFILYMMVVNYVRDYDMVNRLLTTLLVVGAAIVVYGVIQVVGGESPAAPFEGEQGERNTLGGYLGLVGAIAGGIFFFSKNPAEKRFVILLLPALVIVLLFSSSRSGWLSALAILAVLFYYSPKKSIYLIAVILSIVLLPIIIPEVAKERFMFTFTQRMIPGQQINVGGITLDTSSSARIFSYQQILRHILAHPILGYGVTGFSFTDSQYFRTLSEMGIAGVVALFWMFRGIRRIGKKAILSDLPPRLHGMAVGFQAGFWGLLVHALTANTFLIVRIAEPFWCLAGLIVVVTAISEQNAIEKQDKEEEAPPDENGEPLGASRPALIRPF